MQQLHPDLRRRLREDDQQFIGRPLNLVDNCVRAIQANTRYMTAMLRDPSVPARASCAAAFVEALIDTSGAEGITTPVACAKGCFHCCTTYVSCTLPEVFRLANAVRGQPTKEARIAIAAARARSIGQARREIDRVNCPILEDGACSEYAARPAVCRSVLSTSLARCIEILCEGRGGDIIYPPGAPVLRAYGMIMLRAALIAADLPHRHYELTEALEVALTVPDAEARWLAGEPIFAAVPVDRGDNEAGLELANNFAAAIKLSL